MRYSLLVGMALFCGGLQATAFAQEPAYNPYAKQEEAKPAVAPDGTLHWPVFYRSMEIELKYQRLWKLGACRGTNKAITIPTERNRLPIDKMPKGTLEGKVVRVGEGVLLVQNKQQEMTLVATHPAGVSRVNVTGDVPASWLKPGMIVRVLATVDQHGIGIDPVEQMDVISLSSDFKPSAVKPGTPQSITAKVAHVKAGKIQLLVGAGKLRKLVLPLADNAIAHVVTKEVGYISIGDELTAKGHQYGNGESSRHWMFASDVTVVKASLPTKQATTEETVLKPLSAYAPK